MNDFDQMRIRCEKLAAENEAWAKQNEELVQDLIQAHREAEAYARGYVELGKKVLSGDLGEKFTKFDVTKMICNKFDEIRAATKTLGDKET